MLKTIFWALFGAFTALFSGKLHAQARYVVFDPVTRQPVEAATILLEGHPEVLLTDSAGAFLRPAKVPAGASLLIRALNYQHWKGTLHADTCWLEPLENALQTVVVSATLREVQKDASPIPVELYTPRFFRKNPSPNIFEALGAVNGVRPQLNCNICNTGDIHINGMEGPYTMITIDGMPIVSGLSTVYGLSGIPNGMVERIEIVKGPAGTLYGSEAVGGLINVVTRNALTAPRWYVDLFATGIGEWNVDAAHVIKLGRVRSLLGINYFRFQNRLDINADNFTDIALQDRFSVFNKWHFKRKNDRIANVALRYVYENRWGGELQWTPQWRGTDSIYGESIYTRRVELLGQYQLPVSGRRVMADFSWNLHRQDSWYGATPYDGLQQVAYASIYSDLPLGKRHDAIAGAAWRFTLYDDNTPATIQRSLRHLPGLFIQDNIQLHTAHSLLLGIRWDHDQLHGHIFTPRLSWKWAKSQTQILRFTTGSGYRVANIFTEDHAALTGARELVIAEDLLPERSWNLNLNYVQKFFPRYLGFIGLDASAFFTYFSNQILPDYDTDPDKIIYANLDGHSVSTGLTLNTDVNFRNGLKISAGATAMSVYKVEDGRRQAQLFAPPLSAVWTLGYPLRAWGIQLDYTGNLSSPMRLPVQVNDPRPEYSPWYAVHNIQITKTFGKGIELYAGVKNLFGFYPKGEIILRAFDPFDKYVELNNPDGHSFDPAYNYAPVQRQKLFVGIRWSGLFD